MVAAWIAETEAEKASYALAASKPEPRRRLTEQEIKAIVGKLADVARVLINLAPTKRRRSSGSSASISPVIRRAIW
jgi:hypothetical protein